ncbi:hypothetical protein B6D19_07260 [Gilliamella apicola]|nr:hypothetical protein B6D19_07260 [Gilliamella apicola]OTQ45250.1 hypothetical protein B6D20_04455 [Gilliamella apicola]
MSCLLEDNFLFNNNQKIAVKFSEQFKRISKCFLEIQNKLNFKKNIKHIDNKIKALMIRGNNERD